MAVSEQFTPEQIERLKGLYADMSQTLATIEAQEGLPSRTLLALRTEQGWRPRKRGAPAPAKTRKAATRPTRAGRGAKAGKAAKSRAPRSTRAAAVDMPTLIASIRAQLEGALQTAQAQIADKDPEETARLMGSLTRTLQMLRALEKDTDRDERRGDGADEPPLDLAELRRELARKIDLLRQDREGA